MVSSATLWCAGDPDDPQLHPLARYLGLRLLAARAPTHPAAWDVVLRRLRDRCDPADTAARLSYSRLLGERDEVSRELTAQLSVADTASWLATFDRVVDVPDPRERDIERIIANDAPRSGQGHVLRLLGLVPAIEGDPCISTTPVLDELRGHAVFSFEGLRGRAKDPAPLTERAKQYRETLGD
ncbi:hypothetical protein WEH80_21600 [Actinomycetes bacterium KLBMP 9759]